MKQLIQSARNGEVGVAEVPMPRATRGTVVVRTAVSLVSAGTERMAANYAEKTLLGKALLRPDLVHQVMDKVRREGVLTAFEAARRKLDQPMSLGYSCAGSIVEIGEGIINLRIGDRVACAGAGYALHAEFVRVPSMLVARIPEAPEGIPQVSFEDAAFATLGSIALHGVRLAGAGIGDLVAVIGLGLLGQLAVQLLKAGGCRVIGMDIQPARAQLALRSGADQVAVRDKETRELCLALSAGRGVDAVLITADTSSNVPLELSADIAREKAVVVAVGAVGLNVPRRVFYHKELELKVSRSYGPGRYDPEYEEKGRDYPIGFVRWTENRNLSAFLRLLADGKLQLSPLVSHRFPIASATGAYDLITGKTGEPFLGVLITYPENVEGLSPVDVRPQNVEAPPPTNLTSQASIGLLGAGAFATGVLVPALKNAKRVDLIGVCASTGANAKHAANKFGFHYCTADPNQVLSDPAVNTIVIATRHHLHASQVLAALSAGKHVFCEKPLCLTEAELAAIIRARHQHLSQQLMVGFNRRFAPMTQRLKEFLQQIHEPVMFQCRVNAGYISGDHWVQDPEQGGGRIIGELCHFVDWVTFLAGSFPARVDTHVLPDSGRYRRDNVSVNLEFANGSLGTITYVANGDKAFSKERLEVFGGGAAAVIDDFRRLELVRNGRRREFTSRLRQDKGHRAECDTFVSSLKSGVAAISFDEIVAATLATLHIVKSLSRSESASVESEKFIADALSREQLQSDGDLEAAARTSSSWE